MANSNRRPWRMRILIWGRDLAMLGVIFYAIVQYQSKDMLSDAGDVQIKPITLARLDNEVGTLSADPNRQTLIYFFAPWCSICRASINNLEYVDLTTTQLFIVALDYESTNAVQKFVDDVGLKFPVYLGHRDMRDAFQIKGYPSYYYLDENFKIKGRAVGYSTALGFKLKT